MSKDPSGHVVFSVRYLEASAVFYEQLFLRITGERVGDHGWVTCAGFGVWLKQAEVTQPPYTPGAPGLQHLCIKARSEAEVNNLHDFLAHTGVTIATPPRHYPNLTPEWYAVTFLDPDGMLLEVAYY